MCNTTHSIIKNVECLRQDAEKTRCQFKSAVFFLSQVTQEICDPSRVFRLLGSDRLVQPRFCLWLRRCRVQISDQTHTVEWHSLYTEVPKHSEPVTLIAELQTGSHSPPSVTLFIYFSINTIIYQPHESVTAGSGDYASSPSGVITWKPPNSLLTCCVVRPQFSSPASLLASLSLPDLLTNSS